MTSPSNTTAASQAGLRQLEPPKGAGSCLSPRHRGDNRGTGRVSNLSKVTQLPRGRAEMQMDKTGSRVRAHSSRAQLRCVQAWLRGTSAPPIQEEDHLLGTACARPGASLQARGPEADSPGHDGGSFSSLAGLFRSATCFPPKVPVSWDWGAGLPEEEAVSREAPCVTG